jgi:uncharacterized protein
MDTEQTILEAKKSIAVERLRDCGSVLVALSGGVDSAVLLALAVEALGTDRVLAATGTSPTLPAHDLEDAKAIAASLGSRHEVVGTRELERPAYRANSGDRCFHCRNELFAVLEQLARSRGMAAIAYGAIQDDTADDRPGMLAADRRGVVAPLLDAGLRKPDIRSLAAAAGLTVGDKPAAACLASRIPVGTEVTSARLEQVGRAEAVLRRLGFRQFRVRHHGEVARLELDADGVNRLGDPRVRSEVAAGVRAAGFRFVAVDLDGYRSGSLARNADLRTQPK